MPKYFTHLPFCLEYDQNKSFSTLIRVLIQQGENRELGMRRSNQLRALLQHLIGAKLEILLSKQPVTVQHRKATFVNRPTHRVGDFVINKMAIHVSTFPIPSLLEKCKANLLRGYYPIIITPAKRVLAAQIFAKDLQVYEQVDIFSAEEFLATNLYISSGFKAEERSLTIEHLINRYNEIIDACEADRGLKIVIRRL